MSYVKYTLSFQDSQTLSNIQCNIGETPTTLGSRLPATFTIHVIPTSLELKGCYNNMMHLFLYSFPLLIFLSSLFRISVAITTEHSILNVTFHVDLCNTV